MQLTTLLTTLLLSLLQFLPGVELGNPRYQGKDNLADYIGTWVGHTSTGEFKIVLAERKNHRFWDGTVANLITGRHSYVTNSGVKNESLSKPADEYVLSGMPDRNNPEYVFATFRDEVNHKSTQIRLSFVGNDKTRLSWVMLRENETMNTDPTIKVLPGVSVPTSLLLTKVE